MSETMTTTEYQNEMAKQKPSKYRNRKVVVDDLEFASQKEANRFFELVILNRKGEISGLRMQPEFPLKVNGHLICTYIGDFLYIDKHGKKIIEDVKSEITRKNRAYRIKKKLMKACYGIDILET